MSALVRDIFLALTSYEVEELKKFASYKDFKDRNNYKLEEFRECLNKYKMDEYTEPLYYYMILAKKRNLDYERQESISLSNRKDELTYQENLVNLIKILHSENSIKSITIKCRKSFKQHRIQISNDYDIKIIANAAIFPIWEKIEQLELNRFSLTREEAVAAINYHSDVEWIKNWMVAIGYLDPNYTSFALEKFEDYYRALGWRQIIPNYHEQLREDFIDDYISDHKRELPLNPKTIERILDSIKEEKSKRGRKEDTFVLKSTAFKLSVLKHAEQYLRNIAVKSILDIPMFDDDHDFIHDVLVFFKLLRTYRDTPKNEKDLKKRIRKIIHDYYDPTGKRDIDEKFRILKHEIQIRSK
jgi:hypothetical protein